MSSASRSPWTLVREIGLEYAERDVEDDALSLQSPISAERTASGGLLVVDAGPQGLSPMQMQCRTLLLSATQDVLYDSRTQGIDDAYGCLMDGSKFALLLRSGFELRLLTHAGEQIRSIDLSRISRHKPRLLAWTARKTFLVAFFPGPGSLDIAELDSRGRVLWSCIESIVSIGVAASMQLLPDNSILIADELHHVVWQLGRGGSSRIRWGRFHSPSNSPAFLHRPRWAQFDPDGTLLVADSSNGRIIVVDGNGKSSCLRLKNRALFSPSSVRKLRNGSYLVCDAGSRSVFELDSRGIVTPRLGSPKVRRRSLSFPRSVQYVGNGRYLIANTGLNKVVEVDRRGMREFPVRTNNGLFWPRAVRTTGNRTVLIADGRNFRILELSARGKEIHQLHQFRYKEWFLTLQDPHDVRMQPNGNLLITDSPQNLVIETSWTGRAAWVIGLEGDIALKDPHSAQQLPDGRVLIADTHSNRLLLVDPKTRKRKSITEIRAGNLRCKLSLPRYAEALPDGTLVIADTGNNRMLLTDLKFSFLEVLAGIPQSPIEYLSSPRWVQPLSRNEIVLSDHGNHRVLHLRRRRVP